MIFYIGNTDFEWFKFLRASSREDINFWQPSGKVRFQAIQQGAPFLLRLKSPLNKIAGIGFFSSHSILPVDFAWEVFEERNGVGSLEELKRKINRYRRIDNSLDVYPQIGCIILTNPVFFQERDWIDTPPDWFPNIVQGRTYDSSSGFGEELWIKTEGLLEKYRLFDQTRGNVTQLEIAEDVNSRYGSEILSRVRLGQGAFRVLITDTYHRRCAISGERTLPVLDAAHIKPYDQSGPHLISNGLLLRADIHKLFDKGYLTVTHQFKIEVSPRIRSEFENGRDYYQYHGKDLASKPSREADEPARSFLDWHNQNVYRG